MRTIAGVIAVVVLAAGTLRSQEPAPGQPSPDGRPSRQTSNRLTATPGAQTPGATQPAGGLIALYTVDREDAPSAPERTAAMIAAPEAAATSPLLPYTFFPHAGN